MNAEHARLTLKLVEEAAATEAQPAVEPLHQWRQYSFRCRTGQCFAGFASLAAGARWKIASYDFENLTIAEQVDFSKVIAPDGRELDVAEHALEVLGLGGGSPRDFRRSIYLFAGENTTRALRHLVEKYIAEDEEEARAAEGH